MKPIVAAAIRTGDGVWSLPPPNRHCNVIWHIAAVTGKRVTSAAEQGFLDGDGEFLERGPAAHRAWLLGQIPQPRKYLYSEDLW